MGRNLLQRPTNVWQRYSNSSSSVSPIISVRLHEGGSGKDCEVCFDQWNSFSKEAFQKELGHLPERTVQKYKQLYEKEVSKRANSDNYINITTLPLKNEDDHLLWENTWTPKSRSTYVHFSYSTYR